MEKSINIKHKIDFLLLNDAPSSQPIQNKVKTIYKKKRCSECNKRRKTLDESHQICHVCYKAKKRCITSGNKVIDDFIKHVQTNYVKQNGKMLFVPYDKFENVELIGEGGFSKIYKAIWIDCQISDYGTHVQKSSSRIVALKKLNNSKNITSKELNEVNVP